MEPKAHIFACDKAAVYGDVEVVLGPDMKIQKVEDVKIECHFATRKERKKTFMINLCAKLELTELDCATFMFVTTNKCSTCLNNNARHRTLCFHSTTMQNAHQHVYGKLAMSLRHTMRFFVK